MCAICVLCTVLYENISWCGERNQAINLSSFCLLSIYRSLHPSIRPCICPSILPICVCTLHGSFFDILVTCASSTSSDRCLARKGWNIKQHKIHDIKIDQTGFIHLKKNKGFHGLERPPWKTSGNPKIFDL